MRILKYAVGIASKAFGGIRSAMGASRKGLSRGWLKHGSSIKNTLKTIGISGASTMVAMGISNAFKDDDEAVESASGRVVLGGNRTSQAQAGLVTTKDNALDAIRAITPYSSEDTVVEAARAICEMAVYLSVAAPDRGDLFITTLNDLSALARLGAMPQVRRNSELLTNHMVNRSESDRTKEEVQESLTVAHQLATVSRIPLVVN